MKFTIKHWLIGMALFAFAHRIFLSPFFWLSLYPWAWLCHADSIFIMTGRQFDAALPGSLFCLVAGIVVQTVVIVGALRLLARLRHSHRSTGSLPGDAPPPTAGAQQNQVPK